MIKCDPIAYEKCPDKELCGSSHNAIFFEGSECDKFNNKVRRNKDMFEWIKNILAENEFVKNVTGGVTVALIILLFLGAAASIVLCFVSSLMWLVAFVFCALACGAAGGFLSWLSCL